MVYIAITMAITYEHYASLVGNLRTLTKMAFTETRPMNWKYLRTEILRPDEITISVSPNVVAIASLDSKYASVESSGWVSHTEYVFLKDNGTFTRATYDTVLNKVLPTWLKMVSSDANL